MDENSDSENSDSLDSPRESSAHEKDYPIQKSAFKTFLESAENGDSESQFILGSMYIDGVGTVPFSNILSEKWLLKAYKQGVVDSLWDIARLMSYGHKIKDKDFDIQSGKECYEKIIESDLATEPFKKKARKKLDELHTAAVPSIFGKKSSDADNSYSNSNPQSYIPAKSLDDFIGLRKVKKQIEIFENLDTFKAARQKAGFRMQDQSNHLAFIGNPGTGKTEVARIMGEKYKNAGILEFGHVVEVDRSDLVGEYKGQTALKTVDVINSALGGILFIDEAHMLWDGYHGDFGLESISTLVKAMEDYRDKFIVIMAGYTEPMKILLQANPGLSSRIRHHLYFDDYSEQELVDIYLKFATDNDFIVHKDAKPAIHMVMKKAIKYLDKDYGNGRYVRNCFDKTIEKMALRVTQQKSKAKKTLKTIMFMDIPTFEELDRRKKQK